MCHSLLWRHREYSFSDEATCYHSTMILTVNNRQHSSVLDRPVTILTVNNRQNSSVLDRVLRLSSLSITARIALYLTESWDYPHCLSITASIALRMYLTESWDYPWSSLGLLTRQHLWPRSPDKKKSLFKWSTFGFTLCTYL